ncbi:neprilysin-like [Drosophila rhopaloa]|uniref:Membrane metallo-endopeptidase-like 1 n=2 Tax=Drosophila rhopaloa TaxID=1041015 RepID=A0ABM5I5S0_DRORH|nr:neprilysin-like [Drosophila rhopaloa]
MEWMVWLLLVPIVNAYLYENFIDESDSWMLEYTLSNGNEDSSPCTDFYEHACGKYAERHIDEPFSGIFEEVNHKVNNYLLEMVNKLEGIHHDSIDARLSRFYRSCLEAPPATRKIEHFLRLAPPGEGLTWPLLTTNGTDWPKDPIKWIKTLAHLRRYGLNDVLLNMEFDHNYYNNSSILLKLSSPENIQALDFREAQRILRDLNIPSVRITTLLRKLGNMEFDINSLAESQQNGQIMSVENMKRQTGYDWQEFVQTLVGIDIKPNFRLMVENLNYFIALKRQLEFTDPELLGNYIMIKFAIFLQNEIEGSGDSIGCIKYVRRHMYMATSLLIAESRNLNLKNHLEIIEKIFEGVRQQLLLKIQHNRLDLTAEQKDMVSRKVRDTVLNISKLPEGHNLREFLFKYYEGLEIPLVDQDFARDHLILSQFWNRKHLTKLSQPAPNPKNEFILTEPNMIESAEPYYLPQGNVIVVPVDLVQDPFFLLNTHDVFKYSSMGFVLARELMHAIDPINIRFDSEGNLNEAGVEIANSPRFLESLQCFNTTDSNIKGLLAHIGGINLAYSAYLESIKSSSKNGSDSSVIGVHPNNITSLPLQQVFFLNAAQSFCRDGLDNNNVWLKEMLYSYFPFDSAFECFPKEDQCRMW